MRKLFLCLTILSTNLLVACQSSNPVKELPTDEFAKAVNQYVDDNFIDTGVYMCAEYFVYPEQVKETTLFKLAGVDEVNKTCQKEMTGLANYLNTKTKLQGMTADALSSPVVWKYYYNSKYAQPASVKGNA